MTSSCAHVLRPSVPEPPPVARGEPVTPALLSHLSARAHALGDREHAAAHLAALVRERDAFGRAKYGQPLMTADGRNTLEDARQELGDLAQYLYKARMTGVDTSALRPMLELVTELTRPPPASRPLTSTEPRQSSSSSS